MLNRSASLEIQQAFSKPCLLDLISKYTHPLFSSSLFSVSFAMIYNGADQTEDIKHVVFIVVPQFHEYSTCNILRKTIEGYFDSGPSLTFNTIKSKLIMQAFHSSINLQSK